MAQFVSCHVHSIERTESFFVLSVLNLELDLSPVLLSIVAVQIGKGNLNNSSFKRVLFLDLTGGPGNWGEAGISSGERCWGLYGVPLLL